MDAAMLVLVLVLVLAGLLWLLAGRGRVGRGAGQASDVVTPPVAPLLVRFLGHGLWIKAVPNWFIAKCVREVGPVFVLHVSGNEFNVVADTELVRELFKNDANMTSADALTKLMGAHHTLGNERPFHPYHGTACRMQLNPKLPYFVGVLEPVVRSMVAKAFPAERNELRNALDFVEDIVATCSISAFYGPAFVSHDVLRRTFRQLYVEMDAITMVYAMIGDGAAALTAKWYNFGRHIKVLDEITRPVMRERDAKFGRKLHFPGEQQQAPADGRPLDLLQFMMDTPNDMDGSPLDEDTIVNAMGWALLGSMSTTRNALLHLLYDIASHPEIQDRLRDEQRDIVAKHGEALSLDVLHVPYLEAVMRESFRFSFATSIGALRYTLSGDVKFSNGITIQQGSLCTLSPYAVHFDRNVFPDADVFRPERYLEKGSLGAAKGWANKHLLAFGGGVHACPGRFFATDEIMCIVAVLLRKFQLRLPPGRSAPIRYNFGSLLELFPYRDPVPIIVTAVP